LRFRRSSRHCSYSFLITSRSSLTCSCSQRTRVSGPVHTLTTVTYPHHNSALQSHAPSTGRADPCCGTPSESHRATSPGPHPRRLDSAAHTTRHDGVRNNAMQRHATRRHAMNAEHRGSGSGARREAATHHRHRREGPC
jgi:hypothetical protein